MSSYFRIQDFRAGATIQTAVQKAKKSVSVKPPDSTHESHTEKQENQASLPPHPITVKKRLDGLPANILPFRLSKGCFARK
jgi:hypothetical protein